MFRPRARLGASTDPIKKKSGGHDAEQAGLSVRFLVTSKTRKIPKKTQANKSAK
jgi:hypothetical protein